MIAAGPLDAIDAIAARAAVEKADEQLRQWFPDFRFNFFEIKRPELIEGNRIEPSLLLTQALEQRDARNWDFAIVLTSAELIGNYSPYCFAALSRPLDASVVSMSLIDPLALGVEVDRDTRIARISRRLCRLILHSIGHLIGLPQSEDASDILFRPSDARDLDLMTHLSEESIERATPRLMAIADPRLEETNARRSGRLTFAIRAVWLNRRDVFLSLWAARPWEFPRRLSRLTIAAFSTLAVLLMTAEAWDLALAQGRRSLIALVVGALLVTTIYVVVRQQLLVRRGRRRSEQTVVTGASALAIVFSGMLVTYLTLVSVGLLVAYLLFPGSLIGSWAATTMNDETDLRWFDRGQMAIFSASLALLIGALGASFESQHYFRHIIFVDEEI